MYPRNSASPEPIAIGPVVQISDGAVQTSGVTVRIKPVGVTEADGGGTTAYSTDGVVLYTPTQAETNYTSFILIAKKSACIPANVTIVTTAESTAGTVKIGSIAANAITATSIATDAITAAKIADNAIDIATFAADVGTTAYASNPLAKAIWERLTSALTTAGSVGKRLSDNALQTGDSFALIGTTGSGLTSLAPSSTALSTATWTGTLATNIGTTNTTVATNLDAAISSRSTLTQTQVTGGAYALNNASFAFNAGLDFTTTQKAATLARVTLVDTLTTYTSNTPQSGDAYARIGANGAGLTALATQTSVNNLPSATDVWNVLSTGVFTADSFGDLIIISDGSNGREVKVTGAKHIAADVHDIQPEALALFATEDTGETTAVSGSVAKLAQADVSALALETTSQTILTEVQNIDVQLTPEQIDDLAEAIVAGIGDVGGLTESQQEQLDSIESAVVGGEVIHVPSPVVSGNLVLTQGDSYDGIANPKASWSVTTDYTDGWSVVLTIRDADDAIVQAYTGEVSSAVLISVAINAPTGLAMSGCPGQWQGKFDVELRKNASRKTIAIGSCYINEDQTR